MGTLQQCRRALLVFCALVALRLAPEAHSQVVISQVYGGGGNSGAPLKNDFVELFNQGQSAVVLDGWAIEYASASGSSWQSAALMGTILPHHWFLVVLAGGSAGGGALPAADDSGSFGMSATGGKIALLDTALQLSGSCPSSDRIIDFLGWGSATCFRGSGPAPGTSNTTAAIRKDSGMAAAGDNALDFVAGSPNPRNSVDVPLSVQLANIRAVELPGGGVRLTWTTYSEINNFGFDVERKSPTDTSFVELEGSFQQGFGTTTDPHDYVYLDAGGNKACRYRLRQTDLQGGCRRSDTIIVSAVAAVISPTTRFAFGLQNHPNPFNPTTTIVCTIPGSPGQRVPVRLRVFDLLGRLVRDLVDRELSPGIYRIRFDGSHCSSGFYVGQLEARIDGTIHRRSTVLVLLK